MTRIENMVEGTGSGPEGTPSGPPAGSFRVEGQPGQVQKSLADLTPEQRDILTQTLGPDRVGQVANFSPEIFQRFVSGFFQRQEDYQERLKNLAAAGGRGGNEGGGSPGGPRESEEENSEEKEKRPPFDFVVTKIRRLEAMGAKERYKYDPNNPKDPYPNLGKLELKYKQFNEYFTEMEPVEIAELTLDLKTRSELEKDLRGGKAASIQKALQLFDRSGDEDPGLRRLRGQIKILEDVKKQTAGQEIALQVARERLKNGTNLEGEQGAKAKLRFKIDRLENDLRGFSKQGAEQRIAGLTSKASLTPDEAAELSRNQDNLARFVELENERKRLQAYDTYNSPNILVERIKSLRGDPGKEVELKQALIEFVDDEINRLDTEISLIKTLEYDKLIQKEFRIAGQVETEEWETTELEVEKKLEQGQEQGEIPFERLPAFQRFVELQGYIEHGYIQRGPEQGVSYREALVGLGATFPEIHRLLSEAEARGGFDEVVTVVERQIERYLFKAFRIGITTEVHDEFNNLYAKHKIPEVGYYGEVHRIEVGHVHHLADSLRGMDRLTKFRLNGWPRNFLGVIGFAAQRAADRMEQIVVPSKVDLSKLDDNERGLLVDPGLRLLRGEWNPEQADKKAESLIAKRLYWEKSVTGYYQFKIDPEVSKNPYAAEQLHMAVDQWIAYLQSGVIPKNPQDQFREWQQFIGQLAPLAEKIFRQKYPEDAATLITHPENQGRATNEIKALRQQAKFRALAPVAAYANTTDEAEAFSSVLQNLSEDTEGPQVYKEGYEALNGMIALALDYLENRPEWSRVYFQPQGSLGHLSANNGAQQLLEKTLIEQLTKELAQESLSDKPAGAGIIAGSLDSEVVQNIAGEIAYVKARIEANQGNQEQIRVLTGQQATLEKGRDGFVSMSRTAELNAKITEFNNDIAKLKQEVGATSIDPARQRELNKKIDELNKELDNKKKERKKLSETIRRENLKRIGLDQSRDEFLALYGKLKDQEDFKLLSKPEQEQLIKRKELEAKEAIQSAIVILNINGQLSARSGPTVRIVNPELLKFQYKIEKLNEMIDGTIDQIKVLDKVLDIQENKRTVEEKQIAARVSALREKNPYYTDLENAREEYAELAKTLGASDEVLDKREERVPVRTIVRVAQYAVYRAEKVWAEEADRIMKSNKSKTDKDKEIQALCQAIMPDAWNVKKGNLNLTDVLEGVYRDALDRVMGSWEVGADGFFVNKVPAQGFRATLDVPVADGEGDKRVVKKQLLTDAAGNTLYVEDIDRLPESNGMLMAYYGTEEIMTNTISLPHKVAEARDGGGGLLGRALRILDPAFNRLCLPEYERNFQKLQRAIHAGVEANWQRHFQIKIEVLERTVIGANIRKNKTGKPADRYKIIDGNPRNNLLEFGRERLYTTGRIINHAAEILTHADRRSRRAPDLGLYSPMQHESAYDESAVEDTREFMGLINTASSIQAPREGTRLDFLYLKLKGARWGLGYKLRVALESGPIEGGKQWTGLLEKVYTNGDRLNKMWDSWVRSYRRAQLASGTTPAGKQEFGIINDTSDLELEDYISTAEGTDERVKLSMEDLYPDLSYYRLAQAPLWKDGVDPFLPDGTLNFERRELGTENTLMGADNGTSRHTAGIWFERINQWKMDQRKGHRWYPGLAEIARNLAGQPRLIFGAWQYAIDVLRGREVR